MSPESRLRTTFGLKRVTIVALHDTVMAALSFELAVWIRYATYGAPQEFGYLWEGTVVFTVVAAAVFWAMGLYRGLWYYASLNDLIAIAKAVSLAILVFLPILFILTRLEDVPRSAILLNWPLLVVLLAAPRFLYRALKDGNLSVAFERDGHRVPVLLAGVSDVAETFIRQMSRAPNAGYRVVGIVDQSAERVGRDIRGVRVLGTLADIPALVDRLAARNRRPQRLIIAAEHIDGADVRRLLDVADRLGMATARLPRLTDFRRDEAAGRAGGGADKTKLLDLRPIDVEDLLGRPQKVLNRAAMASFVGGRRVLVSGAGGTIGAELVHQIAAFAPAHLTLLDNAEHNLYSIDLELGERHGGLSRTAVLADVRDRLRLEAVFAAERPDLVFHAAAFKQVPLSEHNPNEAVLTNVFGTLEVAECCRARGVSAMVLISTDKAVNPGGVMGASKRVAELICQALSVAEGGDTRFLTVRFGNVLGSSGSVVPLFERQLTRGGPLTVTHPEATRYFMTTREAVELVLQASALPERVSGRGKIFVLDMGEPVRIQDLARQMIRLADREPDTDIKIVMTGLRAGEKLVEELFYDAERLVPTEQDGILLAAPRLIDFEMLRPQLDRLKVAAATGHAEDTLRLVSQLVPEFQGAVAEQRRRGAAD